MSVIAIPSNVKNVSWLHPSSSKEMDGIHTYEHTDAYEPTTRRCNFGSASADRTTRVIN